MGHTFLIHYKTHSQDLDIILSLLGNLSLKLGSLGSFSGVFLPCPRM